MYYPTWNYNQRNPSPPPPFIFQLGHEHLRPCFTYESRSPASEHEQDCISGNVKAILLLLVNFDGKSQAQKGLNDLTQLTIIYEA